MMNKALVVGALALAIGLSYYMTYLVGHDTGANAVQVLWDEVEEKRNAEINRLKGEIAQLEKQHQTKQDELSRELEEANQATADAISGIHAHYVDRLRDSEMRADVYRRKAGGTEAERDALARHAAELDRSLEQGRQLVEELRGTLRLREVTIRALGGIILNDRTLLESK